MRRLAVWSKCPCGTPGKGRAIFQEIGTFFLAYFRLTSWPDADFRFHFPGRRMHAAIERNSWRLPPEDIVQVADPRSKKGQVIYKYVYFYSYSICFPLTWDKGMPDVIFLSFWLFPIRQASCNTIAQSVPALLKSTRFGTAWSKTLGVQMVPRRERSKFKLAHNPTCHL